MLTSPPRRAFDSVAARRRRWAAGVLLAAILTLVVFAILEGDLPEVFGRGAHVLGPILHRFGPAAAVGLLYLEESGVPVPLPGDVFVMYVGHHAAHNAILLVAAWLGLIAAVVFGSSNLYFVSRGWGRSIADRRLGKLLDLTPAHMARAEQWFARWGVWTLLVGRHIPGLRVPLTVAAGIFRVRYPVFVASVAISTAVWAGFFMTLGVIFGPRIGHLLQLHRQGYVILPLVGVVTFVAYLLFMRRRIATS